MAASRIEFGYLFFVLIPAVTALLIAAIVIVTVLLTVRANRRSSVPTPDVPKKPLSQLLRELRSSAGMTQEYVAGKQTHTLPPFLFLEAFQFSQYSVMRGIRS